MKTLKTKQAMDAVLASVVTIRELLAELAERDDMYVEKGYIALEVHRLKGTEHRLRAIFDSSRTPENVDTPL